LDKLRLYILGDGSLFDIVGGQVKDLGLDQQIFLKGAVGPDDIAKYLKAADWLIIPSRSESIPIVFSEAVQSGLPMIASDVGDLGPLIRQYKIGVVVPPADQRALGQAIEAVAADFVMTHRPTSLIQRAATVDEVANMVVYICSTQASATSGAALRVDGGVVDDIL